jgi:hypothetical protein
MRPGKWDLDLVPGTPSRLLDQIMVERFGFAQLVIAPTHLDPRLVGDADLLGAARYVGLYRGQESRTRLSGAHIHVLLGDEDGKGDVMEAPVSTANGFLSEWFGVLNPTSTFINGTVSSPGGSYTGSFVRMTRREAWEMLTAAFGVEWRVNTDFTFDVGPADTLYGATPKVVVLRNAGWGGRDHALTGVQGAAELSVDVEDFTTKIIYLTGDRDSPTQTTAVGANPYTNPAGGPLIMDRLVEATGQDIPSPSSLAAAELGKFNGPRYELRVASDVYDVGYLAPVGSPVYVYDPLGGAYDQGNPVQFRGGTIFPMLTRITGMTWPIRAGMGVYLRRHDGTSPLWVDLTPYVQFETGTASLEVGAVPRPNR